jgi:tyrosyl-tRNA synthetase
VERFIGLFTFLPMEEVRGIRGLDEGALNGAKAVLAFETTQIAHGRGKAISAWTSASAAFGERRVDRSLLPSSGLHQVLKDHSGRDFDMKSSTLAIPTTVLDREPFKEGIPAFELFQKTGLCRSGSEARRLITQGGGYINERRVKHFTQKVTLDELEGGTLILKAGKKKVHRIRVEG